MTTLVLDAILVTERILAWIDWTLLILLVLICLPLAAFKRTRIMSGYGMIVASIAFGLSLWILGFGATLATWGWPAVLLGLAILGVGVAPIGLAAAAVYGEWTTVAVMLALTVLTFGLRALAIAMDPSRTSDGVSEVR